MYFHTVILLLLYFDWPGLTCCIKSYTVALVKLIHVVIVCFHCVPVKEKRGPLKNNVMKMTFLTFSCL